MSTGPAATRLQIGPVIERAKGLAEVVARELPTHDGLAGASAMLVAAAEEAERVATRMQRPLSLHRLPAVFLALALTAMGIFAWWQLVHVSTLTLALPDRDAMRLRDSVRANRLSVKPVEVPGSREAVAMLVKGEVDLGFVQGGVPIPAELERLEADREVVLYLVRPGIAGPTQVHTVLTSTPGEGSHSVAQAFFSVWGVPVAWVHAWREVTASADFSVPPEVDAVLVVKDLGDERALAGVARLVRQGFRLASPRLGARAARFEWLQPLEVPPGHLQVDPPIPAEPIATWSVTTYLVARQGLTPRLLTQAASVLDARAQSIVEHRFKPTSGEAAGLFQGVDAVLSILVNLGLAFLALLGLDVVAYRRKFHQLNSLVSVLSLLQSTRDVLDAPAAQRAEQLRYLGLVSDMLSLVSAIAGYYTQENSSLLFNNLSEVVHQRCDGLKLNIQLKLLHALGPARG